MSDEQITQIITIEDGSLAKAKPLRQNFKFLDDKANANSTAIQNLQQTMVSTINTTLTNNLPTQPSASYIDGLVVSKSNSTTIGITKGRCYDSTKTYVLYINNNTTNTISPLAANTTYHVYIIGKAPSSGLFASACTIFATATEVSSSSDLPTGYTHYREIGSYKTDSEANIDTVDYHVQELMHSDIIEMLSYKKPKMTPLMDWEKLKELNNGNDVRTTNATSGITYWNGNAPTATSIHRPGDIELKEDFTNYPRIMIICTNSAVNILQSSIWETWELYNLIHESKTRINLFRDYMNVSGNQCMWLIYGDAYTNSNFSSVTTNSHFLCETHLGGIVEIYGLTYEE